MKPTQHPTALRTQQLLADAGLAAQVVEFEQPTRTSAEAAAAVGCSVGEIAKSVVFRAKASGQAVVVVASGDNRVCEAKVATLVGHAKPVKLLLDTDLQRFTTVWAAAGTPFTVFPLTPAELQQVTGAAWCDIRQ